MALQSSDSSRGLEQPVPQAGSVGDFFDRFSLAYDQAILKAIPPYAEMIATVLGYCFMEPNANWSILELGCGTGNLSLHLRQQFPNAQLTLVDLSADMLAQAVHKLGAASQSLITPVQGGFMELAFEPGQFDLVVSSMALHHLQDSEKPELYFRMYNWLKPGGIFRCADETLSLPVQVQEANMAQWEAWAAERGATPEERQIWIDHAEQHDHYAPLSKHFQWLKDAGFIEVDCYWRKLMWTVFGCQKSSS